MNNKIAPPNLTSAHRGGFLLPLVALSLLTSIGHSQAAQEQRGGLEQAPSDSRPDGRTQPALQGSDTTPPIPRARAAEPIRGMVGVGTWKTQAEFKDIKVTRGAQTLYSSDFSRGLAGLKVAWGQWQIVDGALRQTSDAEGARVFIGDPTWSDYTVSLRARKLSGTEGFLILFGSPGDETTTWWNLGGWNNTTNALEVPGIVGQKAPGTIEIGRWYDIKIELQGNTVRAFLDGRLVQTAERTPAQRDFGRALVPDLIADPSLREIGARPLPASSDYARHAGIVGMARLLSGTVWV